MQQREDTILQRLGKVLHLRLDDITHEALPRRWVDLIHYLDEEEGKRSERSRAEARLRDRTVTTRKSRA
jgi:hypothetical protein